jgi:hypothetical protein
MEFVESILASLNGVVLDWTAPEIPTGADMSTDPGVLSWSVLGNQYFFLVKQQIKQSRQKYGI